MEVKKNPDLVDEMFAGGEVSKVDPESKYRYSFMAFCPKDGEHSYVNRYETTGRAIENVTFKVYRVCCAFQSSKIAGLFDLK